MTAPRVSVVVPVRDRETLIAETLRSIARQSLEQWECIVVDDGSQDGTREAIEGFARRDDRFRVFARPALGAAAARNFGVQQARAELVSFLDSDDLYLPGGLVLLTEAARDRADAALIYANYRVCDDSGRHLRDCRGYPPPDPPELYRCFIVPRAHPVLPSASIVRRDVYRSLGGMDTSYQTSQTVELWGRLVLRYRIAHLDRFTSVYRRHAGQATRHLELRRRNYDRLALAAIERIPESVLFPEPAGEERAAAIEKFAWRLFRADFPTLDACVRLLNMAQRHAPCGRRARLLALASHRSARLLRDRAHRAPGDRAVDILEARS